MESNWFDSKWQVGEGDQLHSINPSDNSVILETKMASFTQAKDAYLNARSATTKWRQYPLKQRIDIMLELAKILQAKQTELALLIATENGKPLWEATQEVEVAINKIKLSIQAYQERCAATTRLQPTIQTNVSYQPIGCCLVLGPYNFPLHLPLGHIIPALLAGNTIVFKPSEFTPMVGVFIMQCLLQAGVPDNVVVLLVGDGVLGKHLVSFDFDGIFFTGSYQVGSKIHQAHAGKPWQLLALEMGGNNPLVISKFADLDVAVKIALISSFISSGQRCTCARRIILTKQVDAATFIEQFIKKAQQLIVGTFLDEPEPFMGPLISQNAVAKVLSMQQQLLALGGKVLLPSKLQKNNLLTPGIIQMPIDAILDQECFGPLVQLFQVSDLNEAIKLSNDTKYGLAASICTDEDMEFQHFNSQIKAGIINRNLPTVGASSAAPFGGVGCSGNYRPSGYFAVDYCSYPVASMHNLIGDVADYPGML